MAGRDSRIEIDKAALGRLYAKAADALAKTGEYLHTEVVQAQVMPRDTGALQNEGTFVDYSEVDDGTVKLVSSTPYARRLYFHPEYNFKTDENPDAQGEWFNPWINGNRRNDCQKAFAQFFKP